MNDKKIRNFRVNMGKAMSYPTPKELYKTKEC